MDKSNTMIQITEYNPSYHSDVVSLITHIQQQEFAIPITYEQQPDLADIPALYDRFWVALHDDKVVGTIGLKIIEDFAIMRKMFVAENFRGKAFQIAQKLLETLEKECIQMGLEKIYLGTTEFFKAAHRFYERNNYVGVEKSQLPLAFPVMKVDTIFYLKSIDAK